MRYLKIKIISGCGQKEREAEERSGVSQAEEETDENEDSWRRAKRLGVAWDGGKVNPAMEMSHKERKKGEKGEKRRKEERRGGGGGDPHAAPPKCGVLRTYSFSFSRLLSLSLSLSLCQLVWIRPSLPRSRLSILHPFLCLPQSA